LISKITQSRDVGVFIRLTNNCTVCCHVIDVSYVVFSSRPEMH